MPLTSGLGRTETQTAIRYRTELQPLPTASRRSGIASALAPYSADPERSENIQLLVTAHLRREKVRQSPGSMHCQLRRSNSQIPTTSSTLANRVCRLVHTQWHSETRSES